MISRTPSAASAVTSETMSPSRRLTSRPRTCGTMQKAHELSQPIWIVIHAECGVSRTAGSAEGYASCSSRISTIGPSRRARASSAGRVRQVVGAEHDVDVARPRHDLVTVLLGEAPPDRDLQVGTLVLERLQRAQMPVELLVGVLTDAAGVQDDDVGVVDARRRFHPVGREHPRDALRIVLVHLAPEGPDEVATGLAGRGGHGAQV